jgi:threonine dehydratase
VIAGQRTLAVELGEQLSGPLTVVVPVGGGGLVSGVGLWAADRDDVRVVGVEVAASRAVSAAVAAGRVVDAELWPTLADGMAGGLEPGCVTVDIAARHVDAFVAVDEAELRAAMRALAFEAGLIAEGAGAAATAAVLSGRVADDRPGARVVAIVSGRNVTREALLDVLSS